MLQSIKNLFKKGLDFSQRVKIESCLNYINLSTGCDDLEILEQLINNSVTLSNELSEMREGESVEMMVIRDVVKITRLQNNKYKIVKIS